MKRIVLTVAAVLCLGAASYAAENQPVVVKWERDINVSKLSRYLELDVDQKKEVADITEFFSAQMSRAVRANKDQDKKLHNAVYGNLKLMKKTLTPAQYSKYIALINVTLKNKGIELK